MATWKEWFLELFVRERKPYCTFAKFVHGGSLNYVLETFSEPLPTDSYRKSTAIELNDQVYRLNPPNSIVADRLVFFASWILIEDRPAGLRLYDPPTARAITVFPIFNPTNRNEICEELEAYVRVEFYLPAGEGLTGANFWLKAL